MFAPWTVVATVCAASTFVIRPLWAAVPLWLLVALLAWALGASRSFLKALRRLTAPAGIVIAAAWFGWLLPSPAGFALIAASLPVAGFEARVARFRRASALSLPLVLLGAAAAASRLLR